MTTHESGGRPYISVLLPVFNGGATLSGCLASIQRQSCAEWECVTVDDGSNDDSGPIARGFAAADPRFRILPQEHQGLVPALNHGLAECRGKWIARMDADDLMHRDRLRLQLALLERQPQWTGLGCHVRTFPRRAMGPGRRAYEHWLNSIGSAEQVERNLWVECPVAHPTLFIDRATLQRTGYRDRSWPEDYDLLLRLILAGRRIGILPRRLHLWRDHPGRLSRTAPSYASDRFVACKAAHLSRSFLAGGERYVLWGYGSTGRAMRKALEHFGKRPAAIIDLHPGRLGNRVHGAPVLPPSRINEVGHLPLLASVARSGPRNEIRRYLNDRGLRESRDYICTA